VGQEAPDWPQMRAILKAEAKAESKEVKYCRDNRPVCICTCHQRFMIAGRQKASAGKQGDGGACS
jgi:hypothetical protein